MSAVVGGLGVHNQGFKEYVKSFGSAIKFGVQKTLDASVKMIQDTSALQKVIKISVLILKGAQTVTGSTSFAATLIDKLTINDSMIDVASVGDDVSYIGTEVWGDFAKFGKACKEFKPKKIFLELSNITSKFGFIVSNALGLTMWLDELKFINLSKAANFLGRFSVFKPMVDLGISRITNSLVGFSFVILGAYNAQRFAQATTKEAKIHSALNIAWSVAEAALKVFVLSGGAAIGGGIGIGGLIGLGIIASGLGLTAFIYKAYNKEAVDIGNGESKKKAM